MKRILGALIVIAFLAAAGIGMMAMSTPVQARGRCLCPMIYAPVTCDNGRTYSNQCVANCRGGKNCVPGNTF